MKILCLQEVLESTKLSKVETLEKKPLRTQAAK